MRKEWIFLAVLALAGCAGSRVVSTVDASHGEASQAFVVTVDSSTFIGASPARLYMDDQLIATIKRGASANVVLPCGNHAFGTEEDGKESAHKMTIDPCDGAIPSFHIGFESFRGFSLTRQSQ